VVGYVESSVLQQSQKHNDRRERIMSFAAHELPTFTLKDPTCTTYSISIILGREPSKIIHSEQVEKTRSKLMKLSGAAYQRLKRQNGKS